jgi:hypothetical protein
MMMTAQRIGAGSARASDARVTFRKVMDVVLVAPTFDA